jgi:chemotaxis protein CheC
MADIDLSDSVVDGFTEMVNIAMGTASDTLARLLNTFVEIRTPVVARVSAKDLQEHVASSYPKWLSLQPFYGAIDGEVLGLVGDFDIESLGALLGYEPEEARADHDSIVIEVVSALSGSCLSSLTTNLNIPVKCQIPRVFPDTQNLSNLQFNHDCLMIEIEFVVNNLNFDCKLIFLVDSRSLQVIEQAVVSFAKQFNVEL